VQLEHKWDIVDAVSRSPLLHEPTIRRGIQLAEVERLLIARSELPVQERERLIEAARELAGVFDRLGRRETT
jgi:hypothetical protein